MTAWHKVAAGKDAFGSKDLQQSVTRKSKFCFVYKDDCVLAVAAVVSGVFQHPQTGAVRQLALIGKLQRAIVLYPFGGEFE